MLTKTLERDGRGEHDRRAEVVREKGGAAGGPPEASSISSTLASRRPHIAARPADITLTRPPDQGRCDRDRTSNQEVPALSCRAAHRCGTLVNRCGTLVIQAVRWPAPRFHKKCPNWVPTTRARWFSEPPSPATFAQFSPHLPGDPMRCPPASGLGGSQVFDLLPEALRAISPGRLVRAGVTAQGVPVSDCRGPFERIVQFQTPRSMNRAQP